MLLVNEKACVDFGRRGGALTPPALIDVSFDNECERVPNDMSAYPKNTCVYKGGDTVRVCV